MEVSLTLVQSPLQNQNLNLQSSYLPSYNDALNSKQFQSYQNYNQSNGYQQSSHNNKEAVININSNYGLNENNRAEVNAHEIGSDCTFFGALVFTFLFNFLGMVLCLCCSSTFAAKYGIYLNQTKYNPRWPNSSAVINRFY